MLGHPGRRTPKMTTTPEAPRSYHRNGEHFIADRPDPASLWLVLSVRFMTRQFGRLTSTLLPMTPPRMAPAAAPISPPFTLSRLLTAPITAPVAAPIAASRLVCFTTGCGAGS